MSAIRTRTVIVLTLCALLAPQVASGAPQPPPPPDVRPNIVLMLIDDFPAMDERVFERLPNIKALFLDKGVNFTNYWANFSLCCPGRAAILTGQTAAHNGVILNDARLLDATETIATELQGVGYHTIIAGKYLNKTGKLSVKLPPGWDQAAIKDSPPYYSYPLWVNGVRETRGRSPSDYSTRVMAGYARQFLENAPVYKPLFAYFAPNATHGGPDEDSFKDYKLPVVDPAHVDDPRCSGIPNWNPASYNEPDVADKPAYIRNLGPVPYPTGWPLRKACESLLSVDDWLGAIVDELRNEGRYNNTLFVLTSDNGMGWGAHRLPGKVAPYTAQMPLYVSWPAKSGPTQRIDETLLSNIDLAPTFCELARCEMGPYANGYAVDGQSFLGLIDASSSESRPERDSILIEGGGGGVPPFRAIMTTADHPLGQWFLIAYVGVRTKELYDVSGGQCVEWQAGDPGDPCMLVNVASSRKSIRAALMSELNDEWSGPLPGSRRAEAP
ncbi:MAG TPA: sulfatase-like hydrolase/transferase [Candidatus Limnocylindrales bacterium]|jgi:arylsulfatase A-like enzyme